MPTSGTMGYRIIPISYHLSSSRRLMISIRIFATVVCRALSISAKDFLISPTTDPSLLWLRLSHNAAQLTQPQDELSRLRSALRRTARWAKSSQKDHQYCSVTNSPSWHQNHNYKTYVSNMDKDESRLAMQISVSAVTLNSKLYQARKWMLGGREELGKRWDCTYKSYKHVEVRLGKVEIFAIAICCDCFVNEWLRAWLLLTIAIVWCTFPPLLGKI